MRAIWKDKVLAQSAETVSLEGNNYFPPESINMDYFQDGTRQYTCPWKGKSKYWDVVVDGEVNDNSAWSYPEPKEAALEIKGHMAFDLSSGIEITQ